MKLIYVYLIIVLFTACKNSDQVDLLLKIEPNSNVVKYDIKLQGIDTIINIVPDDNLECRITLPSRIPIYNIEGIILNRNHGKYNFTTPIFLDSQKQNTIKIKLSEGTVLIDSEDESNRKFQKFQQYQKDKMEEMWDNRPNEKELENWVNTYIQEVNNILGSADTKVDKFVYSWRGVEYLNLYKGISYLFPNDSSFKMPVNIIKNLPDVPNILDNEYWTLFPNSDMTIIFYLQDHEKELEGQLKLLEEKFKTISIRDNISKELIQRFIKRQPFNKENQKRLEIICKNRKDKSKLLNTFNKKAPITQGSSFPNITFNDKNGHTHQLSEFKGKYVYIDIWASWCAPCCGEVPYLQKLEKELKRDDIVFVSISFDNNIKQWKDKMEQLDMNGNQWIISDNQFAEKMCIKSIPHFLLYDRNGNLLEYHALRPSNKKLIDKLRKLN